jgi:hypothetical protein
MPQRTHEPQILRWQRFHAGRLCIDALQAMTMTFRLVTCELELT